MCSNRNGNLVIQFIRMQLICTLKFTGRPPWSQFTNKVALLYHISISNDGPTIPSGLSDDGKDFLNLCFRKRPTQRPSASVLLDHPFVKTQSYTNGQYLSSATPSFTPTIHGRTIKIAMKWLHLIGKVPNKLEYYEENVRKYERLVNARFGTGSKTTI